MGTISAEQLIDDKLREDYHIGAIDELGFRAIRTPVATHFNDAYQEQLNKFSPYLLSGKLKNGIIDNDLETFQKIFDAWNLPQDSNSIKEILQRSVIRHSWTSHPIHHDNPDDIEHHAYRLKHHNFEDLRDSEDRRIRRAVEQDLVYIAKSTTPSFHLWIAPTQQLAWELFELGR